MKVSMKFFATVLTAAAFAACGKDNPTRPEVEEPPPPAKDSTKNEPPPVGSVSIVAAGNISRCATTNDEATASIIAGLAASDTTLRVIALGDNAVPNGRPSDFTSCYDPSWGRFKAQTWAAIGNHEYDSSATADGLMTYFGDRAGLTGKNYYSFDYGNWHFVVLNLVNTNNVRWDVNSEQHTWLAQDLGEHQNKCTIAIWHDPRFMSSSTVGFTERFNQNHIWKVLEINGVDIILNGGQHQYERMTPLTSAGVPDSVNGILQFNAGLGGESAGTMPSEVSPFSRSLGNAFGVLKLTLRTDNTFSWNYLAVPGQSFTDSGTGSCH